MTVEADAISCSQNPAPKGAGYIQSAAKTGLALYAAASLSLGAALIHLWAVPEHLVAWWGYGVFFLAAALAQGVCAVLLLRWPVAPVLFAGVFGNLSLVMLYVTTRTSGIPFGLHAGKIEDAGLIDMTATVAELGIILSLVALLGADARRWTINVLLLLGAALWVLRLSGTLL